MVEGKTIGASDDEPFSVINDWRAYATTELEMSKNKFSFLCLICRAANLIRRHHETRISTARPRSTYCAPIIFHPSSSTNTLPEDVPGSRRGTW